MLERILAIETLLAFLIRELTGIIELTQIFFISATALGAIYLFANWWIDKPSTKSFRTICSSILYGMTSWALMFAIMFKILFYPGGDQMIFVSFMLLILAVVVDLSTSIGKKRVLSSWTIWRIAILVPIVITLLAIPDDSRISITYRKHPDFLKFYDENKGKKDFSDLEEQYFKDPSAEDED